MELYFLSFFLPPFPGSYYSKALFNLQEPQDTHCKALNGAEDKWLFHFLSQASVPLRPIYVAMAMM